MNMIRPDMPTVDSRWRLSDPLRDLFPDLVELRRDIHAHPELGFQERRTQSLVLRRLDRLGISARPIARTGVVGVIESQKPGRTLLLRADMDALPIQELGKKAYRSTADGVMHACGHDAHTAMLLFVAELLSAGGLSQGRVILLFQPAEEGIGGAKACLDEGLLEQLAPVDAALACHVWTPFPTGEIAILDGPVMASVDGFEIEILGKASHAASPEAGADPVLVACQIATAAQGLVTRLVSAHEPVVLSFTAVQAGDAFNVIPERALLRGTLRTYDSQVRSRVKDGLVSLSAAFAKSFGCQASYRSLVEHGPVLNDASMACLARTTARNILGEKGVTRPRPLMAGEDFGLFLERIPGAMLLLGCGNPELDTCYPHHHPCFDIDERVLLVGVELMTNLAQRYTNDELSNISRAVSQTDS
jgi:amidohydrolase